MTELVFLSWILLSRVNRDYAVGYEQELAGRAIHSTPVLTGTAPGYIIYWWNRTFYGTSGHLVAHSSPGTSGHLAAHSSLGSFYDLNIHCLVSNSSPLAPDLIRTNPEHDDVTSRSFSNHFDFSHWCAPSFKLPLPFSVWSGVLTNINMKISLFWNKERRWVYICQTARRHITEYCILRLPFIFSSNISPIFLYPMPATWPTNFILRFFTLMKPGKKEENWKVFHYSLNFVRLPVIFFSSTTNRFLYLFPATVNIFSYYIITPIDEHLL